MESKKLIIICFTFPPVPGIGGRRWAKYSKYLLRNNIDVQLITAKLPYSNNSDWTVDINELKSQNRIHYFNTNYPNYLLKTPSNVLDKIGYKLSLYYAKWKIKGNYYDKSSLCKKELQAKVITLIELGYNNIILSVGPFYYSTFLIEIKSKYPDVNLILDVRDPWTNNKMAFGYWALPKNRFNIEKLAEKNVFNTYNKFITVANEMSEYYLNEYNKKKDDVITVFNGYDQEDFISNSANKKTNSIVFTGTLYEKAIDSFLMFYQQLKEKQSNYTFHFYGEIHLSYFPYFENSNQLFNHGKIPLNKVYEKIAESSACLLFLTDDLTFSFSTKFVEYLSQKKPILVYSKPGKTGEFVELNQLGFQMNDKNLHDVLNSLNNLNSNYDISQFDVKNLTQKIIQLLH